MEVKAHILPPRNEDKPQNGCAIMGRLVNEKSLHPDNVTRDAKDLESSHDEVTFFIYHLNEKL